MITIVQKLKVDTFPPTSFTAIDVN